MPIPLLPVTVVGLAAAAGVVAHKRAKKKRKKGMSPDQEKIYSAALQNLKDPAKLIELADKYADQGFKHEAEMLRKRAKLRQLPPDVKKQRKEAFRKGLKLQDPDKVQKLADLFEKEGATGSADALRKYAKGLPITAPPYKGK